MVMATPFLDCIRENFPHARITGIVGKNAQGIVRDGPWFDDFIDCEDKKLAGMWRMIKKIRVLKPDMAILLTNSVRSILPVWLGKTKAPIINTANDHIDLELLKPLIKRCNLLVTNDTGPRHYAVALDVPVVVIMGPTDPRYTSANLDKTVVIRTEVECSPCHKKICPTDHRCMTQITPWMVFEAGGKLLHGRNKYEAIALSK
jgi:ADP-heptose:LPS heptosyltransferase